MRALSRRTFLALGATFVAGACRASGGDASDPASTPSVPPSTPASTPTPDSPTTVPVPTTTSTTTTTIPPTTTLPLAADPFVLGVAAGDPDAESAVLWTRLVGADLPESVDLAYEVAADEAFTDPLTGTATVYAAEAHSLHLTVTVTGPSWYRFHAGGFTSPVGRVAPAPASDAATAQLRVASASCQNLEPGFYGAYRDLVEWSPDLVVFLGDFIYEYAGLPLGDPATDRRVRVHEGPEAIDLAGYRSRYAQYLGDTDLLAARAACPWLVIWDDHEVENDYAALTPEQPAEAATFAARRSAAYRAWWEHMPVRLPPPPEDATPYAINRRLRWGDLADVVLIDGRQFRSDQACGSPTLSLDPPCAEAADQTRTMLGVDQEAWLAQTFATATATWTVLGQQTVLTDLRFDGAILNYDQWDGYAPARERLLSAAGVVERLVVLTGDIHLAGVGLLPGIGVEFVTASISSDGLVSEELQPILASFETVVDAELAHRGYTRHTVTPQAWTAEYRIVGDVRDAASPITTWRTFTVDAAERDLVTVT